MALRLLLLKHVRNWSFDTLEREVKMNLAYRDFTRIGLGKVPDAKTLARIAQALGGGVIAKLHDGWWQSRKRKARCEAGRCVWTPRWWRPTFIIRPTPACWGTARGCMTRTMKKIEQRSEGKLKRKVRDRMRSVNKRVVAIATASRHRGTEGEEKRKKEYRELLRMSRQILNDAKRVMVRWKKCPRDGKKDCAGLATAYRRWRRVYGR